MRPVRRRGKNKLICPNPVYYLQIFEEIGFNDRVEKSKIRNRRGWEAYLLNRARQTGE